MMNIVRLSEMTTLRLAEAITGAAEWGGDVRIMVASDKHGTYVKWDAGIGWTPPYYDVDGM